MNYKFGQTTWLGALLAAIALVVIVVLVVTGKLAWMPMGLVLSLIAISRIL